ncbi:MAG: acetyl-CoA carboxylase biotin carboxylase subunit [Herpetosiphon sp.]
MYFEAVLIANRGEIALRVIRACRELGIRSIAVYSEADRDAWHVRAADQAVAIGPTPAAQSYLRIDRLIEAAQQSGAQAIHPGYGFLSERAAFAEACAAAGIVFIGPSATAIERMGSKKEAKHLAVASDVPVVPGYDGDDLSLERLQQEAAIIGYPLLIKASAGGGGKGMRTVERPEDFGAALGGARREAMAAFGDDHVLLEKLLQHARHVEIQVFGDQHGQMIYLGERECSIQRRHQKVIEEAPSPALSEGLRAEMGAAAVRVARSVGYTNAGTVEFMLDREGRYYFLEMNTRLQVEHPVTEAITGLDLVQMQIAVAAGLPLPLQQSDVTLRGHAIEARIYAEDPRTMLPSAGRLDVFDSPQGPGIRNDTGVASGDEVTPAYDPMLGKLIVAAPDRPSALRRLAEALRQYAVIGVTTNLPLLAAIVASPAFCAGDTYTDFLVEHPVDHALEAGQNVPSEVLIAAALWPALVASTVQDPWAGPWQVAGTTQRCVLYSPDRIEVALNKQDRDWNVTIAGKQHMVSPVAVRGTQLVLRIDDVAVRQHVVAHADKISVSWNGLTFHLRRDDGLSVDALQTGPAASAGHASLIAPMPGTIIQVLAAVGDLVAAGQPLVVMEAMKMEHTLAAPHHGRVAALPFGVGQIVAAGAMVVDLDADVPNP